jgi:hypothetical protein
MCFVRIRREGLGEGSRFRWNELQNRSARMGGAPSARLYETGVESPHPRTWEGLGEAKGRCFDVN